MDIVIAAALLAVGLLGAAALFRSRPATVGPSTATAPPPTGAVPPTTTAPNVPVEHERAELDRQHARAQAREEEIDALRAELHRREVGLEERAVKLEHHAVQLEERRRQLERELERVAGLSAGQAKQMLLKQVEEQARHDQARVVRQVEEETKRDADRRVRSILAVCMQRLAAGHAAETTVSVVPLSSDDMKGRIIGREGRNIRALENLTGVDFIIDDTPNAVVLSGFDGVRREVARLTLEKLLQDGRIHPARIEETFYQAKSELDSHIVELGEQAVMEANVGGLDPELVKVLGRLKFRTSYGQNVLAHSIECAHLAAMMAEELGASARTARRAALLHDVGKAVSHEIEGPHALVGGDLARKHGESEAVAHAMEAHHNEVEPQTVEAVIVQAADALSGARPGARGESLESYVKRLRDLEHLAARHPGVEKVYAMQAGREIRIMVAPEAIDDDRATLLSHEIAREIEKELEYPGQIKVTVIRESRAVEYAQLSTAPPRVHRIPHSTNVERVALAAAHKGVAVEWVDHDPGDRSTIRSLSGQDLVPVLEGGAHIVPDSTAILRWFEAQYPDRPLWPLDPGPRAVADIFVEWFNRVWKVSPNAIVGLREAREPDDAAIGRHAAELRAALERFEDLLSAHSFLLGNQLGVADVVAFPFLKYPVLGLPPDDTDPFHAVLVEFMPLDNGYAELRDWVRRIDALPRA